MTHRDGAQKYAAHPRPCGTWHGCRNTGILTMFESIEARPGHLCTAPSWEVARTTDRLEPGARYLRVVAHHGESPPQYPHLEDEDEEEDDHSAETKLECVFFCSSTTMSRTSGRLLKSGEHSACDAISH